MDLIKRFNYPFVFRNKELVAIIEFEFGYEETQLLYECCSTRYLKDLESGLYTEVYLYVTAKCLGESGYDSIGHICIRNSIEFINHVDLVNKQMDEELHNNNMVQNAIDDLIKTIDQKLEIFEKYLGLKYV